jgi:AraC family transcriptional regulator, regulatory protein of adaptative response / methylated-DNA-[protein]-cysteine methyltransferase
MVLVNSRSQFAVVESTIPVNPSTESTPIDSDAAWQQVLNRDPSARFFYAVTTTGVFCRPGCSSRRPLRDNVRFFRSVEEAQRAGFRPCKRCSPVESQDRTTSDKQQTLTQRVRAHIEAHVDRPVSLSELGTVAGMSPFTVQRLFKQAMGVSPLQYQRALRAGTLRAALKQGDDVTNAIYNAGYGSASRAYEGAQLGMTPARFAAGGRGEQIGFTTAPSRFGWLVVGATERGLCWLALGASAAEAEASLREEFPAATLSRDESLTSMVEAALRTIKGNEEHAESSASQTLPLDLRGTAFQLRVWQALRAIPRGETRSYSQLARELGDPNATRAVARACATNRVALVVPCHRVVGISGSLTGYRWGVDRKRQLLEVERT